LDEAKIAFGDFGLERLESGLSSGNRVRCRCGTVAPKRRFQVKSNRELHASSRRLSAVDFGCRLSAVCCLLSAVGRRPSAVGFVCRPSVSSVGRRFRLVGRRLRLPAVGVD